MSDYSFEQTHDADRAAKAYVVHYSHGRPLSERVSIFVLLFLSLLFLSWALEGSASEADRVLPWVFLSLAIAALAAWFPKHWGHAGLRRQVAASMDRMKLSGKTTTYRVASDQLIIEDDVLGGRLPWSEVHAWRSDEELLLVYRTPQFFYYIDKSEVPGPALTALIDHLKASPGKQL